MALAKRLQKYWHDQGYPFARFWTEPLERFTKIGIHEVYRVKCNLLTGRHRGESDERGGHCNVDRCSSSINRTPTKKTPRRAGQLW
jgi:hypothetical protein